MEGKVNSQSQWETKKEKVRIRISTNDEYTNSCP